MELNQIVRNFTVVSVQPVEELSATLYQMEHRKSGARLVWLDRQEENKTFAITFQTQPWDDTGVFHILEHSVLCGSEKYPVKEPFVELMKSSLNTYLNAMTAPDRTTYPVSSRNSQDFVNLVRVYMDAVFHPLIHQKPEIFGQEGWHYEFSAEGEPSRKGVVLNEMKGVFSSPDALMEYEIFRRLFPDTCYRFVSGGDPAHIPELSAQGLSEAHRRLYHPSNAYIFLDGALEIDRILGILDEEYLAAYRAAPAPDPIPFQAPVDGGLSEVAYELSHQESLEGRVRLADAFVACTYRDREEITALRALADVLCGDNYAPLTRRLLENGLAKDLQLYVDDGILQPFVVLAALDIQESEAGKVSAVLREELERLVREGLDHRRILATLDNMEFQARQREYGRRTQGLAFCMQVMESWIYGGDPGANLSVGTLYDGLREKCEEGYFEALLERVLLKNPHRCRVLLRPSHTLGQERQEREAAGLRLASAGWDEGEAAALKAFQERVDAWQASADSPEALASIPMLRLDQIDPEPEKLPLVEKTHSGLKVLVHRLPTSGITYLNLYFSLDDLPVEKLPAASFLCGLLGFLDTQKHSQGELQRELRSRCGQLSFAVNAYNRYGSQEKCRRFLGVSISALDAKLTGALELLNEIMTGSVLGDREKVYDLLRQRRTAFSDGIVMSGHVAAMNRAAACCSAENLVQDYTNGIAYYQWLKGLEEDFPNRFAGLAEELAVLAERIFCQKRLAFSVTASAEGAASAAAALLAKALPEGEPGVPEPVRLWPRKREGIVIPADVSFAGMAGPLPQAKTGGGKVGVRLASLAYLWNAVRVQGGAYGVGLLPNDSGTLGFYSYRDPSAKRTLDCYDHVADFLRDAAGMDVTGFILGTVAEYDPLLTPRLKGSRADIRYWRQAGHEDLCRMRREMLDFKGEDLRELAASIEKTVAESAICVLGSQRQIDQCGDRLDSVIVL